MKKVKNVWFTEKSLSFSGTGLVLELEDGTFLRHQSTDPVIPFEEFNLEQLYGKE